MDTILYAADRLANGYVIRRVIAGGRPMYVMKVYNADYTFTHDYTYAKHFTLDTALRHITTLARRDCVTMGDTLTVNITRRDS